MSRVFLMALMPGSVRPILLVRAIPATHPADDKHPAGPTLEIGGQHWHLTTISRRKVLAARAWWLVEANSADAARYIIATCEHAKAVPWGASLTLDMPPGRILASGSQL